MTENKPIIIDGVDVSGCKLYREDNGVIAPDGTAEQTELCYLTNDYCGNNTNCYFKQLAHKTQECERLQQSENEAKEIIAELTAENKQAEQKLEKIREYCNKYPQNSIGFKKNILQIIDGVE